MSLYIKQKRLEDRNLQESTLIRYRLSFLAMIPTRSYLTCTILGDCPGAKFEGKAFNVKKENGKIVFSHNFNTI